MQRAAGPDLVHGPEHWIRLRRLPRPGAGILVGEAQFLWPVAEVLVPGVRLKHRLCCAVCCMERAPLEPSSENVRVVGDLAAGQRLRLCAGLAYTDIMVRGRCLCMSGTAMIRTLYTRVKTAIRGGHY